MKKSNDDSWHLSYCCKLVITIHPLTIVRCFSCICAQYIAENINPANGKHSNLNNDDKTDWRSMEQAKTDRQSTEQASKVGRESPLEAARNTPSPPQIEKTCSCLKSAFQIASAKRANPLRNTLIYCNTNHLGKSNSFGAEADNPRRGQILRHPGQARPDI